MYLDLSIALIALCVGLFFIRLISGTFNLGKLNIVHITFLLFIVMIFVGSTLVKLGFTSHYTHRLLIDKEGPVNAAFYTSVFTMVFWPASTYLFLRLMKIKPQRDYKSYLETSPMVNNESKLFYVLVVLGAISLVFLVIFISKIGYIPLYKLLTNDSNFNFATERIRINGIKVIHYAVRNILILQLIPLISYIAFAFALSTKKLKWSLVFVVFFLASVVTKTHNFEKVPIIFHLSIYLFIAIYTFGGIKVKWVIVFGIVGIIILSLSYLVLDNQLRFSLYEGAIGRMIMTPSGMLSLHFDMFPKIFDFLSGRSAPNTLIKLFGFSSGETLRSGKLLMDFYGSESRFSGIAGVMSTVFLGESYANFGWLGIIFAIIWTSAILSILFGFFLKFRKTPVTIAFFAYFTINFSMSTQGGFFDIVYNVVWIIFIFFMLVLEYGASFFDYCKSKIFRINDIK